MEWGSLANVAFAKDNSLGRFSANLSYNHTSTETRNGDRRGIVIAESVTFRDPLSAYLAQTDVDLLSLVVTDAKRSRTYLPGRDYLALRSRGVTRPCGVCRPGRSPTSRLFW